MPLLMSPEITKAGIEATAKICSAIFSKLGFDPAKEDLSKFVKEISAALIEVWGIKK